MSTPAGLGSRDSSTLASVSATAPMPTGMFTRNTACQLNASVRMPPSTGPMATEAPTTAPNAPNAMPRSRPWNAWAIRASEVANIMPPPMPCSARNRFRCSGVSTSPQPREASENSTRPITNTRRRPIRSATEPDTSRVEARLRA